MGKKIIISVLAISALYSGAFAGDDYAIGESAAFDLCLRNVDPALLDGAVVHDGGELAADETWSAGSVHVVYGTVVVATNATLTIEPGAVVKFLGGGILSEGMCIANGATFTDIADGATGGALSMPSYVLKGNIETDDATRIRFVKNGDEFAAEGASETFAFSLRTDAEIPAGAVEHGGELAANETWSAGSVHVVYGTVVVSTNATLTIEPGAVVKFLGGGIIARGNCIVNGATFTDIADGATGGALPMPSYVLKGNIETDNATCIRFAKNGDEFAAEGASETFAFSLRTDAEIPAGAVEHGGGEILANETWAAGSVHVVYGTVVVSTNATLTIEPGAVVKFLGGGIIARGNCIANGATFTDIADGATGGALPMPSYTLRGNFEIDDATRIRFAKNGDEFAAEGASGAVRIDIADDEFRFAHEEESIAYSSEWANGEDVSVTVAGPDGGVETLVNENGPAVGIVPWTKPAVPGLYEFRHESGGETLTAKFAVVDGVAHDGVIDGDETWEKGRVHIVGRNLNVKIGATLTIEPGAVVKFLEGKTLTVEPGGACIAEGVVFTSIHDDTAGGDSFNDGDAAQPAENGYAIVGFVQDDLATEYRYGVQSYSGTLAGEAVWRKEKTYVVDGTLTVASGASLTIPAGTVVKFTDGSSLKVASGGTCTAEGAIFTHIADDSVGGDTMGDGDKTRPAYGAYAVDVAVLDSDETEYRYSAPIATSGTISGNVVWRARQVYHVTGNLTLASGATLTIAPGSIVKFDPNVSFTVNGGATLNAQGTRALPIVFTSIKDDAHGGDTNGDGGTTRPNPGDWVKIGIYNGTANFNYAKILYSSKNATTGAINMNGDSGKVVFANGEIAHAAYDAIGVESGSCHVTNSVIHDCLLAFRHWTKDPIVNCVIYDCGRLTQGGGQHFYNCIFSHINETWEAFGFPQNGTTYNNCCFWNEDGSVLTGEGAQDAMTVCGKNGNIWGDPMFIDPGNGDFRIAADSPCVDAGDATIAPAKDWFGQPRYAIRGLEPTGVPGADGAYADIGIHEIQPRDAGSDIDLEVRSVMAPETMTVGEYATVSWREANIGSVDTDGMWYDKVELVSANGAAVLLGTVPVSGISAGGEKTIVESSFRVPAVAEGACTIRVTANYNRDIYEGSLTANNVSLSDDASVSVADVDFTGGNVARVELLPGRQTSYRVGGLPSGGCSLLIHSASGESFGAYVAFGRMPTTYASASSFTVLSNGDVLVSIPHRSGEDAAYLMLDSKTKIQNGVLDVTVGEDYPAIHAVSRESMSNTGSQSLTIYGAGMDEVESVALVAADGTSIAGVSLRAANACELSASFSLAGASAGAYRVMATARDGKTAESQAAVSIIPRDNPKAKLEVSLDTPSAIRQNRWYEAIATVKNTGDADARAPILVVSGEGLVFKDPDGEETTYDSNIHLIALSRTGSPMTIPAGGETRLPVSFKSVSASGSGMIYTKLMEPGTVRWESFASKSAYTDQEWTDRVVRLEEQFGSPAGFLDAVYAKAGDVSAHGFLPSNAVRLYNYATRVANGEKLGIVSGVLIDAESRPIGGMQMAFNVLGNGGPGVFATTAEDGTFCAYGVPRGELAVMTDTGIVTCDDGYGFDAESRRGVVLVWSEGEEEDAEEVRNVGGIVKLPVGENTWLWNDGRSVRSGIPGDEASVSLFGGLPAANYRLIGTSAKDEAILVFTLPAENGGALCASRLYLTVDGTVTNADVRILATGLERLENVFAGGDGRYNAIFCRTNAAGGANDFYRLSIDSSDIPAPMRLRSSARLLAGSDSPSGAIDFGEAEFPTLNIGFGDFGVKIGYSCKTTKDTGVEPAGCCVWKKGTGLDISAGGGLDGPVFGVGISGSGSCSEDWEWWCRRRMLGEHDCSEENMMLREYYKNKSMKVSVSLEKPLFDTEKMLSLLPAKAEWVKWIPIQVSAGAKITGTLAWKNKQGFVCYGERGNIRSISIDRNSYGYQLQGKVYGELKLGLAHLPVPGNLKSKYGVSEWGADSTRSLEMHGQISSSLQYDREMSNGILKQSATGTISGEIELLVLMWNIMAINHNGQWSYRNTFRWLPWMEKYEGAGDIGNKRVSSGRKRMMLAARPADADDLSLAGEFIDCDMQLDAVANLRCWNILPCNMGDYGDQLSCRQYIKNGKRRSGLFVSKNGVLVDRVTGDDEDVSVVRLVESADGKATVVYSSCKPDYTGEPEDVFASCMLKRLYLRSYSEGAWSEPLQLSSEGGFFASDWTASADPEGNTAAIVWNETQIDSSSAARVSKMRCAVVRHGDAAPVDYGVVMPIDTTVNAVSVRVEDSKPVIDYTRHSDGGDVEFHTVACGASASAGAWDDLVVSQTRDRAEKLMSASGSKTGESQISGTGAGRRLLSSRRTGDGCQSGCTCGCSTPPDPPPPGCVCDSSCVKCMKDCGSICKCGGGTPFKKPQSLDPNEMVGPAGAGEERFVKPGEKMDYIIYFENHTNATAAAQDVYVTLPKDAGLDWSTFRLGEVVFGDNIDTALSDMYEGESSYALPGTNWSVRTEVTHTADTVKWHLRIIDPTTVDNYPNDPYAGFLPPNDETGRGEGHLRFSVYMKEDAVPGSIVRASAVIEFDPLNGNAPIETDPAWWNTVTPVDHFLKAGEYVKMTLAELGYDVPTDGTAYNVVAKGLPAGLKLVSNKAETKKVKQGGKTKTVVVKAAKSEWWIEGVPTAAVDFFTNPPYLVITANGETTTEALPVEVSAQEVVDLGELDLGQSINTNGWLAGVGAGWTVSGLPTGLKYATKKVTKKVKSGKKTVVQTVAEAYAVYGKTTKAGLFNITAKKKKGAYYETLKYRVLVRPKAVDTAVFGETLTNITTMAYVPVEWDLRGADGGRAGRVTLPGGGGGFIETALPVVENVVKVAGLPGGVTFAAKDTYKDKNKKQVKQYGQTIVGKPTKPGTYVVTFTKNVTTGTGKKKKTVAKTAQILWTVEPNDAELEVDFNTAGGVVESGVVGLKYDGLMAFTATSNATVTASGLPAGIKLVRLEGGRAGRATLPGEAVWGFEGFTAKAGTYLVTVKATLNGKTMTQRVALVVEGLPAWAKGTFNGYVSGEGGSRAVATGNDADATERVPPMSGLATITVSAAGKISGKFYEGGTNWTVSAASYTAAEAGTRDACPYRAFVCSNVVAKYSYKVKEKDKKGKRKTVTKTVTREFSLTVSPEGIGGLEGLENLEDLEHLDVSGGTIRGVVSMVECGGRAGRATLPGVGGGGLVETALPGTVVTAWQNLWSGAYKAVGKKLFTSKSGNKTLAYRMFTIKATSEDGAGTGGEDSGDGHAERATLPEGTTLTLKVTTAGTVTATLIYDTGKKKNKKPVYYKSTCSTVVIPVTAPDAEEFAGEVPLYFAPSPANNFPGCADLVTVQP